MQTQKQTTPIAQKQDEHILVVKRDLLFGAHPAWHGLCDESVRHCLDAIGQHKEFLPRSLMEQDPAYKQIIPYVVFVHNDRYFLMQRQAKASEQRLKNKLSLGIGGHMRQEDMQKDDIFSWAEREFHEEVAYDGALSFRVLGMLNDDSNDVGKVHIGLVLLAQGEHANISVKSELKSGTLMSIDEMKPLYDRMESWSQMVFNRLALE